MIPASQPPRVHAFLAGLAPFIALLVPSVLFRLPPLINAAGTNSDAAIVGLQAMHILQGEWAWFLFGSGYQTSVDSLVAAGFFLLAGPTPLLLMLSTLVGHLALTGFAFATLKRHLPPWTAALAVLPLVFTPGPLHTYILYPPRQASLTLMFAAIWVLDGASRGGRRTQGDPREGRGAGEAHPGPAGAQGPEASAERAAPPAHPWRYALGGALASLACFADPYPLIFMPGVVLFAALCAADDEPGRALWARRAATALSGVVAGAIPYVLLVRSAQASHGPLTLTTEVIRHNADLLWNDCLPCVLSLKAYFARHMTDYGPWQAPRSFRAVQIAGAALFLAGIVHGGLVFLDRRVAWGIRRLGLLGFVMLPVTLAGFLVSVMVMDFFSARYLVAFVLTSPFALAAAAARLRRPVFGAALAPYLVAAAVAGWVHYGPDVDGLSIHPTVASDDSERRLEAWLAERQVRYAAADYWASYRLTFLFAEREIVVPTNPAEDRYPPYRAAYERAPVVAYIHDPFRSREDLGRAIEAIARGETPFEPAYERAAVGRFTVLLLHRKRSRDAVHAT